MSGCSSNFFVVRWQQWGFGGEPVECVFLPPASLPPPYFLFSLQVLKPCWFSWLQCPSCAAPHTHIHTQLHAVKKHTD